MKKLIILFLSLSLISCEKYITETPTLTLSGKYVVSKLDITNEDQNETRVSLYLSGTNYSNSILPKPFDFIPINRFYIHLDYATIRMKMLGVTPDGRDIWKYGSSPNEIFYNTFGATRYNNGYMQFNYITDDGSSRLITFLIEDDGTDSLQLKSSGAWFNGKFGQKQVMTLTLTRVGP
jgi:hypothetical protein